MKQVGLGFFGSTLDSGSKARRWDKWRPTLSVFRHEDLLFNRFELLHSKRDAQAAKLMAEDIKEVSPETTVHLHPVHFRDPWDFEEVFGQLYDFARDYEFRTDNSEYSLHITTGTHVMQICWFLLAESRHIPARLLQASPPTPRKTGDPGSYRFIDLDLARYDRLATRFQAEREDSQSFLKSGIETLNADFNRLIENIERVALRSREPILLSGPTGAGKSQLAEAIYELKKKRQQIKGPFVEVNCATIRGDGAMSALFGHVKGAYTGASGNRPGLLKSANGGILFLDEIGELGADEQAMLLRALEKKRFLPVGTDKETGSDFELLAGTNRNLKAAVRTGRFREDLLARINLWSFDLPGLAQRREDIAPNLDFELVRVSEQTGRQVSMNREARTAFLSFAESSAAPWAGNFRDFKAAVVRMSTLAPKGRIDEETVDEEIGRLTQLWSAPVENSNSTHPRVGPGFPNQANQKEMDPFDRVQLEEVIRVCQQSRTLSEAGRTLFAVSRTKKRSSNDADRLRKYLQRFDLSWNDVSA